MKTASVLAYISLGSNLGNRAHYLQQAIFSLGNLAGEIGAISPVYQTPAWGFEGEDFFNACLALHTELSPEPLLECLLQIEKQAGRLRNTTGGYRSRTLDLDLIYYGDQIIQTDSLTVPHPSLEKRRFVLKPLADIAPQYYHPVLGKDHRNLLQECADDHGLEHTSTVLYKNRQ